MKITAYITINLFLFSSWYIFLFKSRDRVSFADRLTGSFVLGLAQIIATQMVLGVLFEQLFPLPLFVVNAVVSLIVLMTAVLRGGVRGVVREIMEEVSGFYRLITGDRILSVIFMLFISAVSWLVLLGYLFPSYAWDALYYHLPIVGQIIQSGAIQETDTPSFIQQYMNIFSKNVNLFFLWNIIFLESDVIVDLSQLCFTIAGVFSVYGISVKLGIKEKYAVYASLLFFFTPVVILQSTINYVDAAVSMLFIVAVNFLMYDVAEYGNERHVAVTSPNAGPGQSVAVSRTISGANRYPLIIGGLAAGILLGSKASGPVFTAVIFIAVFFNAIYRRAGCGRKGSGDCPPPYAFRDYIICFAGPLLLIGGYWYVRNWIFYGNPVYFMDVSIFNVTLFRGLKSDWAEPAPDIIGSLGYVSRLFYVWLEKVEYYMYDSRLSGFGPIWFILYLPSIAFSLIYAFMKKKYRYIFVAALFIVTFLVHPRNWFTRYSMFVTGLGAVSFAFAFDYFRRRENILRVTALLLAGYAFFTINSPCIMPLKVKEFLGLAPEERTLTRHKPFNIDEKVRDRYGLWIWLEKNSRKGETLAYTYVDDRIDINDPFLLGPLWNSEYSNRVIYVKQDNYTEWLKDLTDKGVNYILVKSGSREDRWVENERKRYYALRWTGNAVERFGIVYSDEKYRIVKVLGP